MRIYGIEERRSIVAFTNSTALARVNTYFGKKEEHEVTLKSG